MTKKQGFIALSAMLALVAVGFLREYLFEGINSYRWQLYYQYENPEIPEGLAFFTKFSYEQLYYIKFLLTAIIVSIFYVITASTLHWLYPKLKPFKTTFFLFILVFSGSFLLFLFGWASGKVDYFYLMARKLSEVVQSPLALMILLPAFWIQNRNLSK